MMDLGHVGTDITSRYWDFGHFLAYYLIRMDRFPGETISRYEDCVKLIAIENGLHILVQSPPVTA